MFNVDFVLVMSVQQVSDLRDSLMRRCKTHKAFVDSGPYHSIMERLADLKDAVDSVNKKRDTRRIAQKLGTVLIAVYETLEQHIINGGKGVATLLYQELSGQASLPCVRRFVTKCLAAEKTVSPVRDSPGPSHSRGGYRGRGRGRGYYGGGGKGGNPPSSASKQAGRDASDITCFGCGEQGHYKNHCPEKDKPSGS